MKRTTSILILIALLAASAASCGEEVTSTDTTAADTAAVTTEDPTAVKFVADELPNDLDFGGETISWFVGDYCDAYWEDYWADEQNGSIVNDKVYEARKHVEERLNCNIEMERFQFVWATVSDYTAAVQQFIMAGDDTYDIIAGYTLVPLIIEGNYFYDLAENQYIDVDKPWWNQSARELMPSDSIVFLTGDGTLSLIKHSICMFFNQDQLDAFNIDENLYDLVRDGKWTLDKLEEMITDRYGDLNGDSVRDVNDRYGLTFGDMNKFRAMSAAMDVDMYTKNDGGYELTFISKRTVDVFTKLQTLVTANENSWIPGNNTQRDDNIASFGGNYISKMFANGNALFSASLVGDAPSIYNTSTFTLGMIPFPKYDEAQSDYYTNVQRFAHFYIPSTAKNDAVSGAVMEAWSSECYRNVMPAYFETTLKARYSTDSDMAEMFDLIRNNLKVEFGTVFGSWGLTLSCETFKSVADPNYNFASATASVKDSCEEGLAELVEALNQR